MSSLSVLFLKDCDACGNREERVFTDSWTGKELCPMCLSQVLNSVTMSPATEGDNLVELLRERTEYGDDEENDDDD